MTELIGHRGYPALYPENTILGFKEALLAGCGGIELDVRLTKDDKVVVIHDRSLERTTSGKGAVGEHTLKELKKLDAGHGERISALEDVLSEIKSAKILVEIKTDAEKDARRLCAETVKIAGARKNTFFISFSIEAVRFVKGINPALKTGLIFSRQIIEMERYLCSINALCPRVDMLNTTVSFFAKENKLDTYVWTVNDEDDFKAVMKYGVTGLVTNNAGRIKDLLSRKFLPSVVIFLLIGKEFLVV